jgi:hypothetical protein
MYEYMTGLGTDDVRPMGVMPDGRTIPPVHEWDWAIPADARFRGIQVPETEEEREAFMAQIEAGLVPEGVWVNPHFRQWGRRPEEGEPGHTVEPGPDPESGAYWVKIGIVSVGIVALIGGIALFTTAGK